MSLLTELVIFWLINYKDAAPTAPKFPTRLPSKEAARRIWLLYYFHYGHGVLAVFQITIAVLITLVVCKEKY
jgi:hypothetical protein